MTERDVIQEVVAEALGDELGLLSKEAMKVSSKIATRLIASPELLIMRAYDGMQRTRFNLNKACRIVEQLTELRGVQDAVKRAFVHQDLDGGVQAAFSHPLYLEAQGQIDDLQEELRGLI